MTGISTQTSFNTTEADGVTTVFNFTFFAYETGQISVYTIDGDDDPVDVTGDVTLALNSSFIGGTATFSSAPADGLIVLIQREVDYTQETEFADITRYKETAIEQALNTIVMQIQQVKDLAERAVTFSISSGVTDATIGTPEDGAALVFDGVTGNIAAGPTATAIENAQAYAEAAEAAAAAAINGMVDFSILSVVTPVAPADLVVFYDTSGATNAKATVVDFLEDSITQSTAETTPVIADSMMIYDASALTVKKVTLDNFFKTITGLTEDTSPAVASDYVVTYDASASAAKKVLLNKIGSFGSQLLHVREEQVSGTNGGTFTNGAWRTRVINTAKTNEIGASLGSNQITLLAGTYFVIASAPAAFTNSHKAKLYNITDAADVILGTSEYNGTTAQTRSWIIGRFTISGTKVFEIQHQCQSTRATDGLGTAVSFGTEIFTEAMFWKVA